MRAIQRFFALVLILLAACAARNLRDAQDQFSGAATAENAGQSYENDAALLEQSGAVQRYQLSLALVDGELAANEAELRKDRLYGTALMLKAMCHWRLADLDETGGSAETHASRLQRTVLAVQGELAKNAIVLGQRDLSMSHALPGLRDHDRGRRAETYADAKRFYSSALEIVEKSLDPNVTPKRHPVRIYLRLAQMATCREWHAAIYDLVPPTGQDVERKAVKKRWVVYAEELNAGWRRNAALKTAVLASAGSLGISNDTEPSFKWTR